MKVAFIGLGSMGSAMAPKLIGGGHSVTLFNRTRSRAEEVGKMGAAVAGSPEKAVAGADAAITMLADDRAVEELVFGPDGILGSLPAGAVHLSMSTISVALSRRLQQAHREKGQEYVAAPVLGRPDAAAAAKLFVVAAGGKEPIERCRPLFELLGQKTFVAGEDAPAANVIKLSGNFLITTTIEALAEAMALVRKQGGDPEAFLDILTGSLFTAPVYRTYGSLVAADRYEPVGFRMPLGLKDNRLLLQAAEEAAVPMPMASLVHDRFVAALAQGLAEADWSAIARIVFRSAGL